MADEGMDAAATRAEEDLAKLPDNIVHPVARWFANHYMTAGHKRLGRILVEIGKGNDGMVWDNKRMQFVPKVEEPAGEE